ATLEAQVAVLVFAHLVAGLPRATLTAVIHLPCAVLAARHALAEVAEEERRHASRIGDQLALEDVQSNSPQRRAHRPGTNSYPNSHARHLTGLGLSIAVPDVQAGCRLPHPKHLGVQR